MKNEQKPTKSEGHDFVDSFFSQSARKELFLSLSCNRDNPIQLIQLLNALNQQGSYKSSNSSNIENCSGGIFLDRRGDPNLLASDINGTKKTINSVKQNDTPKALNNALCHVAVTVNNETEKCLSGWPMLSIPKITMQKCEKCSQEFFSPINYKRHIRIHRRSLNINKFSSKNRENLCAFIDKLSLDEQKELFSLNNVSFKEVTGMAIVDEMISLFRKQWFNSLPPVFVNAGADLLDILQSHPSKFPISSQMILRTLDDASEKTFFCTGNVDSLQKVLFDGDIEMTVLDVKNVISCISFLLEKKLDKALLDDKDAEALRCQKLLEEEETAAQKRQTDILERKKQKKSRQKKQKAKKTCVENEGEIQGVSSLITVDQLSCSKLPSLSLSDGSVEIPNELLPDTESVSTSGEKLDKGDNKSVPSIIILEKKKQKNSRQKKQRTRKPWVRNKCYVKGALSAITVDQLSCSKLSSLSHSDGSVEISNELLPDNESISISGESLDKGEIKGVSSIITRDQLSCSNFPRLCLLDGSVAIPNELFPNNESINTSGESLDVGEIKDILSDITVDQLSCLKLSSLSHSDGSVEISNELLLDNESISISGESLDKGEIKGVSSIITRDQLSCSKLSRSSLLDGSVAIPNDLFPNNVSINTSGESLDIGEIKDISSDITGDQLSCSKLSSLSLLDGIPSELLPNTESINTLSESLEKGVSSVITVDQLSYAKLASSSLLNGSVRIPYGSISTLGETVDSCGLQSEHCDLAIDDDHRQCEIDIKRDTSSSQIISKSNNILNDFRAIQTTYLPKRPVKNNKGAASTNKHMVWTKKPKPEMEGIDINEETTKQESYQTGSSEILIGSITVLIPTHNALPNNIAIEKKGKQNAIPNGRRHTIKQKRRLNPVPAEKNPFNHTFSPQLSSIQMAEDFFIQRWKAALASNDVTIFSSSTS